MTTLPNTKLVPLTQGLFATIDDQDFEKVSSFKWKVWKNPKNKNSPLYAVAPIIIGHREEQKNFKNRLYNKRQIISHIRLHRLIMEPKKGQQVDHINHDGLDNRRCNLRICSPTENQMNRKKFIGSSRFKGVRWNAPANKWDARITINKKTLYLGVFVNEEEAALAYDEAAIMNFGPFCLTNF